MTGRRDRITRNFYGRKLSGSLIVLSVLLAVDTAGGEPATMRRYNEARQMDLKLREPPAAERQDQRLRELQLRQQRQWPPTDSSRLDPEPGGQWPRFEREQRGQVLESRLQSPRREPARPETTPWASPLQDWLNTDSFFNDR